MVDQRQCLWWFWHFHDFLHMCACHQQGEQCSEERNSLRYKLKFPAPDERLSPESPEPEPDPDAFCVIDPEEWQDFPPDLHPDIQSQTSPETRTTSTQRSAYRPWQSMPWRWRRSENRSQPEPPSQAETQAGQERKPGREAGMSPPGLAAASRPLPWVSATASVVCWSCIPVVLALTFRNSQNEVVCIDQKSSKLG